MAKTVTLVSKDGKNSIELPEDDQTAIKQFKYGYGYSEEKPKSTTKKAGE